MNPKAFINALAALKLPNVFNPYSQRCELHDLTDADYCRRLNLETFLTASLDAKIDTIWIARDLGYRGGRRTGVPLTDEIHLNCASELLGVAFDRATSGPAVAERTAAIVWQVLRTIGQPAILWNIFPLHPHESGDAFSNRCHTSIEREATIHLLLSLIKMVQPKNIIAIGRDSLNALEKLEICATGVRHPSYGGQRDFIEGICRIYGIEDQKSSSQHQLLE